MMGDSSEPVTMTSRSPRRTLPFAVYPAFADTVSRFARHVAAPWIPASSEPLPDPFARSCAKEVLGMLMAAPADVAGRSPRWLVRRTLRPKAYSPGII
jgi:hypothetical protein